MYKLLHNRPATTLSYKPLGGKPPVECDRGLTKPCFEKHPLWARAMLAARLISMFAPPAFSSRLQNISSLFNYPAISFDDPPAWAVQPPPYLQTWQSGPPGFAVSTAPGTQVYGIVSNTSDGYVRNQGTSWAATRDAAFGDLLNRTVVGYGLAITAQRYTAFLWRIYRSFFDFDLSTIPPGDPVQAFLWLTKVNNYESFVCVQQGIHSIPFQFLDFSSFTGPSFGNNGFVGDDLIIDFNADGLAYIKSVLGSTAKLCCREYDHDYLDVEITAIEHYYNGCWYAESFTGDYRPYLIIVV